MTSLVVLVVVSAMKMRPSVSIAASILSLGLTLFLGKEFDSWRSCHLRLWKSISFNQLSSKLMIVNPYSSRSSIFFAHCWRTTKLRCEFPWKATLFTLWWHMSKCFFKTLVTCLFLTSRSCYFLTASIICWIHHISSSLSLKPCITAAIALNIYCLLSSLASSMPI